MSVPLYIHGRTDVGRQRERNEDSYDVRERGAAGHLLVVCDGMGGHGGGDVASQIAVDTIVSELPAAPLAEPPAAIYQALRTANVNVLDAARTGRDPAMGTTAVVAWIEGRSCWVGWVGDSRLYHYRGGVEIDRTVDHTRVQKMVELGILTPEAAKVHPDAHILTQAIGGGEEVDIKPSAWNEPLELADGDVLLLCSDGLYDLVDDDEIYGVIAGHPYERATERLIVLANDRGGVDNITVVICVVGQPTVPHAGQPPAPVSPAGQGSGAASTPTSSGGSWWRSWLILIPVAGALALGLFAVIGGAGLWAFLPGEAEEATPPPPPPILIAQDQPPLPPPGAGADSGAAAAAVPEPDVEPVADTAAEAAPGAPE